MENKNNLRIATVFSGIGAHEYALKRMGIPFETVFACDIDKFCKASYFANYDITEQQWFDDIHSIDGRKYRDKVDLFVGGSPCQSFSIVGKKKGLEDPRGLLIYEFVRLIKEINPKVFIYENVKGLITHNRGKSWEKVANALNGTGYTWYSAVLNAKDYGIPQNRSRLFVVGFREPREFEFPAGIPLALKVQDLLEKNVPIKYYLSDKMKLVIMSEGTKDFHSKPGIDLEVARPLLSTMHKMHRSGIDNYVTGELGVRRLIPRECLRLMGFDDRFRIVVSDTQTYRQAGNAMVVDVLINLLNGIMEASQEREIVEGVENGN